MQQYYHRKESVIKPRTWFFLMKGGFYTAVVFSLVCLIWIARGGAGLEFAALCFIVVNVLLPVLLGALKNYEKWSEMSTMRKFFLGCFTVLNNPVVGIIAALLLFAGAILFTPITAVYHCPYCGSDYTDYYCRCGMSRRPG